ncbi:MAG TPA: hypothetical protein ENJ19_02170, partial [Gammaproteobacteria bacterium]|nr:hypothetical protein [Gammaproteobacteria bacterium]
MSVLMLSLARGLPAAPIDLQLDVQSGRPSTAGPLVINRVELQFENGRGDITVPLNASLKAQALINYTGNGVLAARWVVDGRPIQQINRSLSFGSDVVIETGDIPPLPTFEPGSHRLSLQILQPRANLRIPVLRYFVRGTAAGGRSLQPTQPANGMNLYRDQLA